MSDFEYKTVAAPRRVKKVRGVKGRDAQLAHMIAETITAEATEGWRYMRTDTFEAEEKSGWFSKSQIIRRSVLIFARATQRPAVPQRASERATASEPQAMRTPPAAPVAVPAAPPQSQPMQATRGTEPSTLPPLGGATRD